MAIEGKTAVTVESGGERAPARERPPFRLPARFEFIRSLGEGGMGTVVAARDTVLDREVAIKLVLDDSRPSAKQRFAQEARAALERLHDSLVPLNGSLGRVCGVLTARRSRRRRQSR